MGFFGKSEEELKQMSASMDKQNADLANRESDLNSREANLTHERRLLSTDKDKFEAERSNHAIEVKRIAESIAASNAVLEKLRFELALKEAEAKTTFADSQREAFREVFEKRQATLDARQRDLDALAVDVVKRLESLHVKEGDIATRELAVTEREQKADAGFADRAKALADGANRQHRANQTESGRLEKLAAELDADRNAFEEKKVELTQREQAVKVAEQMRDLGFADERAAFSNELREKRAEMETEIAEAREQKLSNLEAEIDGLRAKRLEHVSQSEQSERERIRAEISKELEAWTKQQDDARKQLEKERTELEKQKGATSAFESKLQGRERELEEAERILERKEQRLEQKWRKRNDEQDSLIEERLAVDRGTLEDKSARQERAISDLREYLQSREERLRAFEQLEQQLNGVDPGQFLSDIKSRREEVMRLQEEAAMVRTGEMRVLESQIRDQKALVEKLMEQIAANETDVVDVADLRRKNSELNAENKSLSQRASLFEGAADEAQAELKRLRSAYQRPAEVAARYKEIEMPHVNGVRAVSPVRADISEMGWLEGVSNACDKYGLHFHPRLLKAFHTALKTAEWSPLTILAGVSGTGKSELPRLYSHFGGLLFEALSVQPNWDSQESMLGFFNSIDNKFDAQPVLRFLAQSQQKSDEKYGERVARWQLMSRTNFLLNPENDNDLMQQTAYPGLRDHVCLVLLDEMNIAYPELYFAEFLSKLELRRGMKGSEVPSLPVKIGAGLPPYQLGLGRNVLWTGTMNQDETTKSLSDKVLDRSIIVHFPRPTTLERRLQLAPLDDANRGTPLHRTSWQNWLVAGSSFRVDEIEPYKQFLEAVNSSLGVVGRAIGHRVWQSVEYYMANYPDVRAAQQGGDKDTLAKALHIAFEDQLVQKVMPKLRGIDTSGKSKIECLDKILVQINAGIGGNHFNLAEDFEVACELGHGQFIWQSANYLNKSEASK
jgi:hypothetical protein